MYYYRLLQGVEIDQSKASTAESRAIGTYTNSCNISLTVSTPGTFGTFGTFGTLGTFGTFGTLGACGTRGAWRSLCGCILRHI